MKLADEINKEYADITEKEILQAKENKNQIVLTLLDICRDAIHKIDKNPMRFLTIEEIDLEPKTYTYAREAFEKIEYSSQDITELSLLLSFFDQDENNKSLGLAVSACVNAHAEKTIKEKIERKKEDIQKNPESKNAKKREIEEMEIEEMTNVNMTYYINQKYIISTEFFPTKPFSLGYRNKNCQLTIQGNGGRNIGWRQESGVIIVGGDVTESAGQFKTGGLLNIKGNAGHLLGYCMYGGSIRVEKNAGSSVGANMKGGNIYVNGKMESITSDASIQGKIYSGGVLVHPKKERR